MNAFERNPYKFRDKSEELKMVLDGFRKYLEIKRKQTKATARGNVIMAGWIIKWCNNLHPTKEEVEKFREWLINKNYSKSTIRNMLFAMEHYFRFSGKEVHFDKPRMKRGLPHFLTEKDVQQLLFVIDSYRDFAIVSVLAYSGVRVSELCNLDVEDIDYQNRTLRVRHGKGDKDRDVVISQECINAINEYLKHRPAPSDGSDGANALFLNKFHRRFRYKDIENMVRKYADKSGIMKRITPHVLRHTLATNMLAHGCPVAFIQKQLGHNDITTTMIYTHVDLTMLKKAYDEFCPKF